MLRSSLCILALGTATLAPCAQQPWSLDEIQRELALRPDDAYLQYVGMQLARRGGDHVDFANRLQRLVQTRRDRQGDVDVFTLFTGALAVQESLQLDTLRGERAGAKPQEPR